MSDSIPDKPSQAEGDVGDDDVTQGADAQDDDQPTADDRP